jgi:protein-S-isoprenylcysteine O-methyltransferase Ste14
MKADDLMRRVSAVLGSAVFLVVAPGSIAGWVPWSISRWQMQAPLLGFGPIRIFGGALIVAAVFVLLESFGRFALQGLGTPAPVFPPKHLVVRGLYRFVRNPMYVAVVSAILGQGLLFGDVRVLEYGIFVGVAMHVFVIAYEEPTLRRMFAGEYEEYCARVGRWIPRMKPWREDREE